MAVYRYELELKRAEVNVSNETLSGLESQHKLFFVTSNEAITSEEYDNLVNAFKQQLIKKEIVK